MKKPKIILGLILLTMSLSSIGLDNTLASPVLDAKEAFRQGDRHVVGIQLTATVLLPGIKPDQQDRIRQQHRVSILNRQQKISQENKDDIRKLYKFKRYANRYNLTIMKLIKAEKLEQKTRYRY